HTLVHALFHVPHHMLILVALSLHAMIMRKRGLSLRNTWMIARASECVEPTTLSSGCPKSTCSNAGPDRIARSITPIIFLMIISSSAEDSALICGLICAVLSIPVVTSFIWSLS
ncbi:hypothetical protein M9458_045817, partial [Cirrhinus mrigala]